MGQIRNGGSFPSLSRMLLRCILKCPLQFSSQSWRPEQPICSFHSHAWRELSFCHCKPAIRIQPVIQPPATSDKNLGFFLPSSHPQVSLHERPQVSVNHTIDIADLKFCTMVLDHPIRLQDVRADLRLSLIHISEPTRRTPISY